MTEQNPEKQKPNPTQESEAPDRAAGNDANTSAPNTAQKTVQPVEVGGQKGPEPTRYGDWEKNGIISDF